MCPPRRRRRELLPADVVPSRALWLCVPRRVARRRRTGLRRFRRQAVGCGAGSSTWSSLLRRPSSSAMSPATRSALRYDYDFFLGPVNAMRHGHPLLVDTFSQYGVGMFYALSRRVPGRPPDATGACRSCYAWLTRSSSRSSTRCCAWPVRSQLVAVLGLAAALVANLGVTTPVHCVSQHGAPSLRVTMGGDPCRDAPSALDGAIDGSSTPMMLLTVGSRARSGAPRPSSAGWRPTRRSRCSRSSTGQIASERSLHVAKRIAAALVVAFVAVGATSAVVLVVAGDWPRWTDYLSLVALYAMQGFGSLLIPAWSPGYILAALSVLSLTALVGLPGEVRRRCSPTIAATAGATVFGAVAFTYFLGRSAPSNLHHVASPCGRRALRLVDRRYATAAGAGGRRDVGRGAHRLVRRRLGRGGELERDGSVARGSDAHPGREITRATASRGWTTSSARGKQIRALSKARDSSTLTPPPVDPRWR